MSREPSENQIKERFLLITEGKPFAWAERHGIERWKVQGVVHGTFKPQKKTLDMLQEKTGLSSEWLLHGVGEPFPSTVSEPVPIKPVLAHSNPGTMTPEKKEGINADLLALVIQHTMQGLQEKNLTLPSDKLAQFIAIAYEQSAQGQDESAVVQRFLRLVS